ncbi:helix-turn-helix domain-containing protein [Ruminococcus flavefaciens]|uniref:helix-turn-helix domain-containing protein n=1 Tax=Ruminococcus flavefaciens TaxID=1265 RepID=UPI001565F3ED|nr:helix-turn-helix transcriptional regulator [Ruminococcus flavefaciens]
MNLIIYNNYCIEKYYDKYRTIGLKISYYRKLRGMTQEQLAEKIEKNLAFIGAVEAPNVNRAASLDTLFDIAEALDIPAYKFLVDDE